MVSAVNDNYEFSKKGPRHEKNDWPETEQIAEINLPSILTFQKEPYFFSTLRLTLSREVRDNTIVLGATWWQYQKLQLRQFSLLPAVDRPL
jgi:hypothetical protein